MKRRSAFILPVVLAAALVAAVTGDADTLGMKGGERLMGRVLSEGPDHVVFESQTLGILKVPRAQIESLAREPRVDEAPPATSQAAPAVGVVSPPTVSAPPAATPAGSRTSPNRGPSGDDRFDWIELSTGEWLKGKVKSLQEETLEFDSEKLDFLTFDWDDIRSARLPGLNSIRIEHQQPVVGSLWIDADQGRVVSGSVTNTFRRESLLAVAPTGDREWDKWSAKLSAGVGFRSGNAREVDVNAHLTLQRRTPESRFMIDYLGNYGKVNGVETEQNQRATGTYDYFISRRLYARVVDIEYYRDVLQNIEHRLTLGAGVGYDLIKTRRTEWNVTVGPAWQGNWFRSVPEGESPHAGSSALVLATRLDVELTRRLDLILEYRGQLTGPRTGNDTHHAVATMEFEIHKLLELDLSLVWDRISSPQQESGGSIPTPDDFRLITSIGIDF